MSYYTNLPIYPREGDKRSTYYHCDCLKCSAKESVRVTETMNFDYPSLEVFILPCDKCGAQHTPTVFGYGNETPNGLPIITGIELAEND